MDAIKILTKLQDLGYETYFVGGCVRDMILDIPYKDIDIATSAEPDELIKIFKDQEIKTFGKSFLVTFINGIEVATFRTDKYNGLNDKNVQIEISKSAEEDVKRRDFTINSLLYDPITKKVIDYVNGQEDLKRKIIRFNGDPKLRIWEDPNRIIRACRFVAKINGDFEDKTYEALVDYSDYVETMISPERIRLEILKAMEIKKASIFFRALYDIGALEYIFPSLDRSYLHTGGPYHIEDVFDHCMMAGDHASTRDPLIKLAAYLHDIGKPISSRINPHTNDIWFEGHEETGKEAAIKELENLRFSNEEINIISNLIYLHMRISHERLQPKSIRRTLKMLNDFDIPHQKLLRVSICDKMGGLKSQQHYRLRDVYQLAKSFRTEVNRKDPANQFSDLKVNGIDIMEATGLLPGKEVGDVLKYLLNLVIDNPELNEKEKLLRLVRER
jgi:tRNA nucleotidyltransferase (CCA-adding enzyme)